MAHPALALMTYKAFDATTRANAERPTRPAAERRSLKIQRRTARR